MNTYKYTAKNKNGDDLKGMLEGNAEAEVIEALHKKELLVLSVELAKKQLKSKGKKIKLDDLAIFCRQLTTMIDAGIPLLQALGILSEQVENASLKKVVMIVCRDIEGGIGFCDALSKHPKVFSELFVSTVRAGETSGMLGEILERLATYFEKTAALTRKIQASMIYPAVVISIAVLGTAVLLLTVVPTFKGIFESFGGQLPLPTRILIAISDVLKNYFWLVLIFLGTSGFLFRRYANTEKGRYNIDAQKLKFVVLGPLFCKIAVAKFSRTFSTLVKSGVPILNVLDIVAKTSGNKIVEEAIKNCRTAVRDGEPIAKPLSKSGIFPPMVSRMISVGEQTGKLETMLSKIADFYDEQVDTAVAGLTSAIEPLVILFLGVMIGGIVIALFMPIFKITELIAK